jgi:amidase/6-aminohexanoate-cyclic-dimer hydrolase
MLSFEDYAGQDARALADLVQRGDVTPAELLDCALRRLDEVDPRINAIALLGVDAARATIDRGLPAGPFSGVPFLLKDLGPAAIDHPSHFGSRLFANTRFDLDSELVLRLKRAGLVIFGRTTSPELGIGPVTEAKVYGGPTRNPWNLEHTAGGSSGGAAAAVAAGILPAAHGSDGAGSIRIPASASGLFGLKPTRARIPAGPLHGEGWAGMAIDGFLTRSVRDAAALLDAVAGPDLGAPYHAPPLAAGFVQAIQRPPARQRIAFSCRSFLGDAVHPDCRAAVEKAAALLADLGHHVEEADPRLELMALMQAWLRIAASGVALSIRQKLAARECKTLDPDEVEGITRGALALAGTVSGADYLEAVGRVHRFGRDLAGFFETHDLLVTPTLAEPPARVGRFAPDSEDIVAHRLGPKGVLPYSPFTAAFNASGQPAMSVPLHWNAQGLPIGVHVAARFGADETLIALAAELEAAAPWFDKRPLL